MYSTRHTAAQPDVIHSEELRSLFNFFQNTAKKLKKPKVRLITPRTKTEFTLTYAWHNYSGQNRVFAAIANPWKPIGNINAKGDWTYQRDIEKSSALREIATEILNHTRQFATDPETLAKTHGKQFNYCCFCGAELTAEDSVAVGYGPICAEKWGLPHEGMAKEIKQENITKSLDFIDNTHTDLWRLIKNTMELNEFSWVEKDGIITATHLPSGNLWTFTTPMRKTK